MEFHSTNAAKLTALKQLLHVIVFADSQISPHAEIILKTLATILSTIEEAEFLKVVDTISRALGLAVDSSILIPILLKAIQTEGSKNTVNSLCNYMVAFDDLTQETIDVNAQLIKRRRTQLEPASDRGDFERP